VGAEVQLEKAWRGVTRLAGLLAGSIRECFDFIPTLPPEEIPVLIGVAEHGRAGRLPDLDTLLLPSLETILQCRLNSESRLVPLGRISGALAIREAVRLITAKRARYVVVAGVDSYLSGATLASFGQRGRLLTAGSSNGFIPGEAAAAVLVADDSDYCGLKILSLGLADEAATIGGEKPLRADGLTRAHGQALAGAGLPMENIAYRLSTLSGEQYFFKEMELATSRLLRNRHEFMDLWHPADSIGETGAAAVPVCIGVAWMASRKFYAPGRYVLASASSDDEMRAAMVLDGGVGNVS
jgi:3-oxoacyl-[acyl-carrier-protein] synthase-1